MIYTNIEGLKLIVKTSSYKNMGDSFINWIEENTIKLYVGRTLSEDKTSDILKRLEINFEPQCFFFDSISKKCYFLDFLLVDKNIALEVDGGYHKLNKEYDRNRDKFFKSIGIKTIRIKNEEVSYDIIKDRVLKRKFKSVNKNKQALDIIKINNLIRDYNRKYDTTVEFLTL